MSCASKVGASIAPVFDVSKGYSVGDVVTKGGTRYVCKKAVPQGFEWGDAEFTDYWKAETVQEALESGGGGGGGTKDYELLSNKPKIEDVELDGNVSAESLGLAKKSNTLAGYGITDATIDTATNTITLGDKSITPVVTEGDPAFSAFLSDTKIVVGDKAAGGANSVVLGNNAVASKKSYDVSIGHQTSVTGESSTAIGKGACVGNGNYGSVVEVSNAVQLGEGRNLKDNTLQFRSLTVVDSTTEEVTNEDGSKTNTVKYAIPSANLDVPPTTEITDDNKESDKVVPTVRAVWNVVKDNIENPTGGTAGQVLTKTDDGVEWADTAAPAGGSEGQIMTKTADGTGWADSIYVKNNGTGKWHKVSATTNASGEVVLSVMQDGKDSPVSSDEMAWTFDLGKTSDIVATAQLQDKTAPYASNLKISTYSFQVDSNDRLIFGAPPQGATYLWGFKEGHSFEVENFSETFGSRTKGHANYKSGAMTPDGNVLLNVYAEYDLRSATLASPYILTNETSVDGVIFLQAYPYNMQFSSDGSKFFYKSATEGFIRCRNLAQANKTWTMSDVDDDSVSLGTIASATWRAFIFSPDGRSVVLTTDNSVYHCKLGEAWNLSSGLTELSHKSILEDGYEATAVAVNKAGTKMIIHDRNKSEFYEFNLSK